MLFWFWFDFAIIRSLRSLCSVNLMSKSWRSGIIKQFLIIICFHSLTWWYFRSSPMVMNLELIMPMLRTSVRVGTFAWGCVWHSAISTQLWKSKGSDFRATSARHPIYVVSAMCRKCPTRDCQCMSWLFLRKIKPGGTTTSPNSLGPVMVWSQTDYRFWKPWPMPSPRAAAHAGQRKNGCEWFKKTFYISSPHILLKYS